MLIASHSIWLDASTETKFLRERAKRIERVCDLCVRLRSENKTRCMSARNTKINHMKSARANMHALATHGHIELFEFVAFCVACAQQWHRHTRCKMLHIDLKWIENTSVPRPRRLIPNESTYDSITSFCCCYQKFCILRAHIEFKCRNATRKDEPNEHIAVATEKHAGLVFCVFQLSSTSETGICSARTWHVIQTMNNTRFAQMTFMSHNIFLSFVFSIRKTFSASSWCWVCVSVLCGQSKSRTCMNLSAATTANQMPFTNAGRQCSAHSTYRYYKWKTSGTRNGRQTNLSRIEWVCRTKTCRRSSLSDIFCSVERVAACRGERWAYFQCVWWATPSTECTNTA